MKNLSVILIAVVLLTSCNSYYKAVLAPAPTSAQKIEDLKTGKRYFILRDGNSSFTMNNISFSVDQKTLQCTLDSMPPYEHRLHLAKEKNSKMKFKDKKLTDEDESEVLNEVHIYVNNNGESKTGLCTLQLDKVQKIEVLEKDKEKTRTSHTVGLALGISGAVVGAAVIIGLIAASSFSVGLGL